MLTYIILIGGTTDPIIIAPDDQQMSDIAGSLVVYTDFEIELDWYLYDISTGMTERGCFLYSLTKQINQLINSYLYYYSDGS